MSVIFEYRDSKTISENKLLPFVPKHDTINFIVIELT
jgi:hypothetical protein